MLRNDAKHLPQMFKALARIARLAECSLRGLVLGREVSRHGVALIKLPLVKRLVRSAGVRRKSISLGHYFPRMLTRHSFSRVSSDFP